MGHEDIQAIPYLTACLAGERRKRLGVAVFLIALGGGLGALFAMRNTSLAILAMLVGITGLKLLTDTQREESPSQSALIRTLRDRPSQVVWVYSVVTENMPFGIRLTSWGCMVFKLKDGGELTATIPAKDTEKLTVALRRILPYASFGYSDDKMQWFLADPEMLYRFPEGREGDLPQ